MKKLIMVLILFLVIVGCSNDKSSDGKNDLVIVNSMTSIGALEENNQSFDKQKLTYKFTISNKAELKIEESSIELVLIEWTKERLIEDKISEINFNEDNMIVKGYVIFDSKESSKEDIVENQPLIDGFKVKTQSGDEIIIKHEVHKE
jgi:hypothetical protein